MAHMQDFDAVGVNPQELDTVVADPESKLNAWRLQFDDVTGSGRQVIIDSMKDSESHVTVDGAQLGPRIWRPNDDSLFRHSAGDQAELPQDLFMGSAFASSNCIVRGIERGGLFRRGRLVLKGRVRQRARHRIGHDFQQLGNSGELAGVELIEKLVNAILVYGHVPLSPRFLEDIWLHSTRNSLVVA